MIREKEEPTRDAPPDPVLGGYRLDASPRRREARESQASWISSASSSRSISPILLPRISTEG